VGESEFYQNVTAAQIEFLADIGAVRFDRAVTDEKLFADFFARFVFGNEFQNAAFGRRQVFDAGFFIGQSGGAAAAFDEIRR
jgi:hypothetical protein